MSGFEIVGVILGAYPLIIQALDVYRATKGGKGAISLARQLKTEEIIFNEFVYHLVAPSISNSNIVRYKISAPPDLALWRNCTLQGDMRGRLGVAKADNLLEILEEIEKLLSSLQEELNPSDHGIV